MSSTLTGEDTASPTKTPFERNLEIVKNYHHTTKHRIDGYARGPETLDWDNQPNPFRYYNDSPVIPLSLETQVTKVGLPALFSDSEPALPPQPINHGSLSEFFRTSFGLAAWKQYGPDTWALRVNPSSGNLHPTEVYCLLNSDEVVDGNQLKGLMHYQPHEHALELRAIAERLEGLGDGFLLMFTSVLWRESWKYGERAYRYCQLDMGHAFSCASYAARALGWRAYWLPKVTEAKMTHALGLQNDEFKTIRPEEGEVAECCVYISRSELDCSETDKMVSLDQSINELLSQINQWSGVPNPLGEKTFYKWPKVNSVAKACDLENESSARDLPAVVPIQAQTASLDFLKQEQTHTPPNFDQLVLRRRSAQRFQQQTMSKNAFKRVITNLLACEQPIISSLHEQLGQMHFVMMVHDVEGMEPGLYVLPSNDSERGNLQQAMTRWPEWQAKETVQTGVEKHVLYHLKMANFRKVAGGLCCHQAIAVDCNFTVGYLARFEQLLDQVGSYGYRSLFWQAGSIAQQIYLAATYEGVAATGIGCYFDDPCHEILGLTNHDYQVVYQMAVGYPIVDERIAAFSGYYHLAEKK